MPNIIPVILCGGEGRRLWPLSTPEKPKPFHSFGRERSLFAEALLRCRSAILDSTPVIVASEKHEALVRAELQAADGAAELVLEPCARNTCAAVIAGALQAMARNRDALVLVLASDHIIEPASAFHAAVLDAETCAAQGYIVTFGVLPDHPSSAFGYIMAGAAIAGCKCLQVKQFREKPGHAEACALLAGGALWNSGNFLARASLLAAMASAHVPQIWLAVSKAMAGAERRGDRLTLEPSAFAQATNTAFDVALLEQAENVAVQPVSFHWRDLGSWAAIKALDRQALP